MAPGVSRQKNNYFYKAYGIGLPYAHYCPPLVDVQSVLSHAVTRRGRNIGVSLIDGEVNIPLLLIIAKDVTPMQSVYKTKPDSLTCVRSYRELTL